MEAVATSRGTADDSAEGRRCDPDDRWHADGDDAWVSVKDYPNDTFVKVLPLQKQD
jgi:hypothetical protein